MARPKLPRAPLPRQTGGHHTDKRKAARVTERARLAESAPGEWDEERPEPPELPYNRPMYSVTRRIGFCYGHRLLDYDGICKHPHGHNATAEIEIRTDTLDHRGMVVDFADIKRVLKEWIDRELDHKMILRRDDPLVKPLAELNEPVCLVDTNPTVELLARLIFDAALRHGFPVVRVTIWETENAFATYTGR